jgi:hypothetical protein
MNPLVRARLEVLGAAFLFSTGGAAIKAVEFSSWQIAGLRSGVAAVAVWLLIPSSRQLRRGTAGRTLLVALAYAATLTLFVLANRLTTAANTIFLQATAPIYIVLFGPLLLRERVRGRDLLFMVAVAAGMALFFVGQPNTFATAPDPIRGNILAAFSGVTYGCLLMGFHGTGRLGESAGAAAGRAESLPARHPRSDGLVGDPVPRCLPDRAGVLSAHPCDGPSACPRGIAAPVPGAGPQSAAGLAGARRVPRTVGHCRRSDHHGGDRDQDGLGVPAALERGAGVIRHDQSD